VQGRRIRSSNSTGQVIYSLYAQSGQLLFQRDERSSKRRQYIYLGGSLVAESAVPLAGGAATVTYQHTDALGSPVATTNSAKTVLQRSEYEPYGYLLNRPMEDGLGYTGHVTDAATGLVYMQQRYMDPLIGQHFLAVDPVTPNNPGGAFNRYWYANANPYRLKDPDGRYTCDKDVCKSIESYRNSLIGARSSYKHGSSEYKQITAILKEVGTQGSKGPHFSDASLGGNVLGDNNQNGTIKIDTTGISDLAAAKGIKSSEIGAMVLGHEVQHTLDVRALTHSASNVDEVRTLEQSAYATSRTVDQGFGRSWTQGQYDNAVQGSVNHWIEQKVTPAISDFISGVINGVQ
jgi:RHS repeat-associated protein